MDVEASFGAWIRQRRKALDLTQDDLARQVGCSVSAIRKIEADERRPSRQIAELLAKHLEIPPDDRARFLKVARAEWRVDRLPSPAIPVSLPIIAANLPLAQPSQPPAPQPAPALPIPPTLLIGRRPELAQMAQLLDNSECRLLTLLGPGGIGKTRLALQAALEAARRSSQLFPDGVAFVPLAPARSPEFILPALANAIGFSFYGPGDPRDQILGALRERAVLLVLDNVEHLLANDPLPSAWGDLSKGEPSEGFLAGLVSQILHTCPGAKLLATSRERLNLQGEWVFEIHGLPVPPAAVVERLEEYSAVALFAQSARRARFDFELDAGNREAVVRICQLTDGLPLAIELAAAWTRMLSCAEIVQEIERSLDFLAASARDLPERHRSLRTVFDHSWNLLAEREQEALQNLSVFQGSFRREAAAEVAGASLPLLSALVDKSLLRRGGDGRYDLHELVRQYASEKLREQPDSEAGALERHAIYFLGFLQEREDRLNQDRLAVDEVRLEMEDIRSAWLWALREGRLDLVSLGTAALARFYRLIGLLREGEASFDLAVERVSAILQLSGTADGFHRRLLARMQVELAGLLNERAHYTQASETARQAVELAKGVGDDHIEAAARLEWGVSLWRHADSQEARRQVEAALALARPLGAPRLVANILAKLGTIDFSQGRISEALSAYQEALELFRKSGDRHGESGVLNRLGTAYFTQGNLRGAGLYYEKALQILLEFGDRRGEGMGFNHLGVIHQGLGQNEQALAYFEKTLPIMRETGDRRGESAALSNLGVVSHRLGDLSGAKAYYEAARAICQEIGEWGGEASNLSNLGWLAYHLGDLVTSEAHQLRVLQMAREVSSPEVESLAWLRVGRVWIDQERLEEARDAYRQALALRRDLGRVNLALEPMAGLARVELALGELEEAREQVEDTLAALELPFSNLLDNADDPYWVYLSCVLVLRAGGDPRASEILEQAYQSLQKQAAQISDEGRRKLFLESLPGNRELAREWERNK